MPKTFRVRPLSSPRLPFPANFWERPLTNMLPRFVQECLRQIAVLDRGIGSIGVGAPVSCPLPRRQLAILARAFVVDDTLTVAQLKVSRSFDECLHRSIGCWLQP